MIKFKVGDRVKLKTGTSMIHVTRVSSGRPCYLYYHYPSSEDHERGPRRADDFEHYSIRERQLETQEETTMRVTQPKLYRVTKVTAGAEEFGEFLATTGDEIILKMIGSGKAQVFKPGNIEVVQPFTVDIQLMCDSKSHVIHRQCSRGELAVDDLVVFKDQGNMGYVMAVDTKNETQKKFDGWVLTGHRRVPVDEGTDELPSGL